MELIIFVGFWVLVLCAVFYVFSFDTCLDNVQRSLASGTITCVSCLLVLIIGSAWEYSIEPHPNNISRITELCVNDVILPNGNVMKVVVSDDGRTAPVNSIINYNMTEDTKFYQITTKIRFSGIAFIPSRQFITDRLPDKKDD